MAGVLIRNLDWVLTMDPQRRMIRDGAIAVSQDRIVYVGTSASAPATGEVIDGRGLLALPGLIDASVASVQYVGKGAGDGCDVPRYRLERTLALEGALTAEDARAAARACQLEMIRAGTTTFVDTGSRFPDEVAAAAVESGLRGVVPRACYDVEETFIGPLPAAFARESTDDALRLAAEATTRVGNSRVHAAIALPWLGACTDVLLAQATAFARKLGVQLIVGAGFSRDDAVASRREHHRTEVTRLAEAGALGRRTLVSHGGWISPTDMRALVETGTSVACCPATSHRLGTGALEWGRFPELQAFGLNVALGSGSAMAGNHVDLVRQLFQYCGAHMSLRLDATVAPPESALEMATLNGARALGLEADIGSLEQGKKADIALFRTLAADWVPVINPVGNLAFSARGGADTVIADGAVLMRGGEVKSLDEAAVLEEVQKRADALMDRTDLRRFCAPAWPVE